MLPVSALIQRLDERLDAHLDTGDSQTAFDEEALADAEELRRRRITDIGEALRACYTVASWHFCRSRVLPGEQRESELRRAMVLFATIRQVRPEWVPEGLWSPFGDDDDWETRLSAMRDSAIDSRDPAALNLAAAVLRNLTTGPDGVYLDDLAALAEVLWARAEITHDAKDLDETVTVGRDWLDGTTESHPDRALRLWRLGLAEFGRYIVRHDLAYLDEAITRCRGAVDTSSATDPKLRSYVADLGVALHHRATHTEDVDDIDAAVAGWQLALAHTPAGHTDHGTHQFNLASMRWTRFTVTGDPAALDAVIASWRKVVGQFPTGHQFHVVTLPLLVVALQTRAERNGDLDDVDESIGLLRPAIASGESGYDMTSLRSSLGQMLWFRYSITGGLDDLEQAIAEGRGAIARSSPDSALLVLRKSNLSTFLLSRYLHTSNFTDITEAAELARWTVASMTADHKNRGVILSNAGNALRKLAERTGDLSGFETAAALFRDAIDTFAATDFRLASVLSNLAITLHRMAEWTGDPGTADKSVDYGRRALECAVEGAPHQADNFANLSTALRTRYTLTGSTRDLDEAVHAAKNAVNRTPAAHPRRASYLSYLAASQIEWFRRFGESEAIDEAIARSREAVDLTPAAHSHYATRATVLAEAYQTRFRDSDDVSDLETAVTMARDAVASTSVDDPLRTDMLANLAEMLCRRAFATTNADDLDQAAALARDALETSPRDSPHRATYHWVLAMALNGRSRFTGDDAGDAETIANLIAAAAVPGGRVPLRIRAADMAARMLMHQEDAESAYPLLRQAVGLLPRLARHGLDRRDQQHLLESEGAILAMDAAACALSIGDPHAAVRLLEQGRGVLWGNLLDLRSDRGMLRAAHPELAAELQRCLAVLDPAGADEPVGLDAESAGLRRQAGNEAARRLDELLVRIRALPATEAFPRPSEFMGPPSLDRLLPPPGTGPIVILNASRWRCDALVLTETGVSVMPLPFTQPEATAATNRYLNALLQNSGPVRSPQLETEANQVFTWLWDHIGTPVLDHLGYPTNPVDLPRVWWCPTGPLTLLPIHAAGHHDHDDGPTMLDHVVSSYTPTLRALAHARSQPVPTEPAAPLLVSIAETPGRFKNLSGVAAERRMLTELFGADIVSVLSDADATRDAIVARLGTHSIVHIASHGVQDLSRPAEGGLVPFDWETAGLVRVDDLAGITDGPKSLAFLSACQTATGGSVNLDEAVNLAAAMQHAGWPHVIGTLWTVFDQAASKITEHFYRRLIRDGQINPSGSAHALHNAVSRLRTEAPRDAAYWARFVHFGP